MKASANNLNQTQITDTLIDSCRNGDVRAFRELYNAYSGAMYNICLRMTNNVSDAEDTLQEAFIQVHRNIHKLENAGSVSAWIKRIVVNHCLNTLRKKKVYFEDPEVVEVEVEQGLDEEHFSWTVAAVRSAIDTLPHGYRTVLNLYLFEEYSHREISEMLGISESTTKTQYMRAKEKVRQIVKQQNATR
ncbi:sigma-70 family RNA polymerase sigma factor [Chitinophaga silvatica]|uniref:Sigma-70 family RNA polymerase sigma factor n=1 Tax=Chitinophaga silvatica TaxID=2282649 RepID=A0A3E1Y6N8_9BACT|nr:sigma-70 family RNA polymerase sigma factor [Chitinophaga silvatica]RFS20558.1 sigma-70 family RNA polymerase sigma factor [Chitinophaga silvatica]